VGVSWFAPFLIFFLVIDPRDLLQENSLRAILNGGTLGGPRRIKAATLPKLVDLIAAKHPGTPTPPSSPFLFPFLLSFFSSFSLFRR
jgi:hypothetical protein